MKTGIDCRLFSSRFTGIGRYTHELVENFIKLNERAENPHELVLFFNSPEYENFAPPAHVTKILVNARHYSIDEQFIFLKKLNAARLDLVHFPHFNVPVLYNKPYIVTIHDLTLSMFPGQKMTKWYHRIGYNLTLKNAVKKAKKIIAVSENTKKDLIKLLGIPAEKIQVIYNGIAPEFRVIPEFKYATKSHSEPALHLPGKGEQNERSENPPPFLLYAGVWRSHKNLPRLIQAFKIIKANNPDLQNLKLVITGNPDPHYPEIKTTVKLLGLENEIEFPGLVPENELIKLYNQAAIFVFPSLYEGFGLPPLEAMSCGTPVAASNASSIPEICGTQNAIFFDPHDTDDIAKKILTLYKDKELQQKLIKNGLAHAARFSWEKTATTTFEILLDCLNKRD
ncbi:glycosyltransferase family 4 protein [Candidatus Peregrinibacteria bacterium]|nr:glycosyltransferase family 4 protein [Candidatus Peregrinibacteria bacterium]